jgi:myo-inositol-1(or 4)-monophosphatase
MISALRFAIQTAKQTGHLLVERFVHFGTQASSKPDNTLVTQADLDADERITTAIRRQYPNDLILSEESNTLSGEQDRPVWVIDPLDGTTNFSLGLPIWGVSIARVINGFPQTAALYFPMLNELYSAEAGQGAMLNQVPLESGQDIHQQTSFFACCSRTAQYYSVNLPYKTRILGAATYNLCCVARSSAIMSMEVTPKIWDLAAAWLIVQESGCPIDVLEGQPPFPLQPNYDYESLDFPTIAAVNTQKFRKLKDTIQKRKV